VPFFFRKIVDGKEGNTVLNGHEGGVDTLYTLANHFMSGMYAIIIEYW
jgi:hypothetical protein